MRRKVTKLAVGTFVFALAAAGCQSNTGTGNTNTNNGATQASGISYDPKDSLGPARAPEGAAKGGTINVLFSADFDHLDPARNYVNIQQVTALLLYKTLTAFKEEPQADGSSKLTLVGFLATDPGKDVNKDCKTWEYTLKKGVKYEDGTEVTAADVAYGVARSFSDKLTEGPHYIQNWLTGTNGSDYNKTYKGPYDGGAAVPPGVTVKDNSTITFTLPAPHCDFPYAASMPNTSPVPAAKDTKDQYDNRVFSSGPYQIKDYKRGTSLDLVRNTNWDPALDPIVSAYPDAFHFDLTATADSSSQRLVADSGTDKTALSWSVITPEVLPQTTGADMQKRVIQGPTQYVDYLYINTQRVTDINVRKALNVALDKDAALKTVGGTAAGSPQTELMSPTTQGFQPYDVFGVPATGDPAKAKTLLAGATPKLVMCHANTQRRTDMSTSMKASLEKAGFQIVLKPIDADSYYTELGKKTNTCDVYRGGWGSDWPQGATIIPPVFDGRTIGDTGNQNLSYMNDEATNAEIDRINTLPAAEAGAAWSALDKKIMTDVVPVVPLWSLRTYEMHGSKVGGAFLSGPFGATSLDSVFVMP